jgi:hypothetical protein
MQRHKKDLPWPWRVRGLYVVLGVSLVLNAITVSFIAILNSPQANFAVMSHAISNSCDRNYALNMTTLPTTDGRVLFSEALCNRDATTGQYLTSGKVVDGHYVLR